MWFLHAFFLFLILWFDNIIETVLPPIPMHQVSLTKSYRDSSHTHLACSGWLLGSLQSHPFRVPVLLFVVCWFLRPSRMSLPLPLPISAQKHSPLDVLKGSSLLPSRLMYISASLHGRLLFITSHKTDLLCACMCPHSHAIVQTQVLFSGAFLAVVFLKGN